MDRESDEEIGRIAALNDPLRRALYRHVSQQGDDVSRDEAADALGISRSLAAFHLDRLVECGLLTTTYRRPAGRAGPGAGRPTKLYRRGEREVEVSIPPRRYELAARLFALAFERADSPETAEALADTARSFGHLLGSQIREAAAEDVDRETMIVRVRSVLEAYGYEPQEVGHAIRLRNCPFHALATEHRSLVCGMNLELIRGLTEEIGVTGLTAELAPEPGMCCVRLHMPGLSDEETLIPSRR